MYFPLFAFPTIFQPISNNFRPWNQVFVPQVFGAGNIRSARMLLVPNPSEKCRRKAATGGCAKEVDLFPTKQEPCRASNMIIMGISYMIDISWRMKGIWMGYWRYFFSANIMGGDSSCSKMVDLSKSSPSLHWPHPRPTSFNGGAIDLTCFHHPNRWIMQGPPYSWWGKHVKTQKFPADVPLIQSIECSFGPNQRNLIGEFSPQAAGDFSSTNWTCHL